MLSSTLSFEFIAPWAISWYILYGAGRSDRPSHIGQPLRWHYPHNSSHFPFSFKDHHCGSGCSSRSRSICATRMLCVCVFKPRCRRVWPRNAREPYHCYYYATAAATADVVWGCRTHSFTIWCTWCDCDNVVLGVHSVTLSCAACAIIPSRQINQKHPYTRRIFARFASNYLRLAILKYGVRCVTFDRIRKRPNGQRRHTLTFHWKFYIKMLLCWVSYTSSYPFGVAFWRSISWRSDGHTFESSKQRISRGRG